MVSKRGSRGSLAFRHARTHFAHVFFYLATVLALLEMSVLALCRSALALFLASQAWPLRGAWPAAAVAVSPRASAALPASPALLVPDGEARPAFP